MGRIPIALQDGGAVFNAKIVSSVAALDQLARVRLACDHFRRVIGFANKAKRVSQDGREFCKCRENATAKVFRFAGDFPEGTTSSFFKAMVVGRASESDRRCWRLHRPASYRRIVNRYPGQERRDPRVL